jgi:hypothetical protein
VLRRLVASLKAWLAKRCFGLRAGAQRLLMRKQHPVVVI